MIYCSAEKIGVHVSFNLMCHAYHTQVPFGWYAVFHKACFTGHYFTGNSIAAAENTCFFQKYGKKTFKIIIRPARPLNNCLKMPISRLRDPPRGPYFLYCPVIIDNNHTLVVGLWVGLFGLGCGLNKFA